MMGLSVKGVLPCTKSGPIENVEDDLFAEGGWQRLSGHGR